VVSRPQERRVQQDQCQSQHPPARVGICEWSVRNLDDAARASIRGGVVSVAEAPTIPSP
jgi:hypothetical protein